MSRFISVHEAIKLPMLASDDVLQRSKGRLLSYSKYVYHEMNLTSLKIAKRQLFKINKLTNTVDLPKENIGLSSVSVIDMRGIAWPVYRNDKIRLDLLDVSAAKNCNCEFNCNSTLCNMVKGYEAVASVKSDLLPNGKPVSFNCVDRKMVDDKGFVIQQTQAPKRIYTNGVWTNTIMDTVTTKLCKVEVDANGCVCDTQSNLVELCVNGFGLNTVSGLPFGGNASTPPSSGVDQWIYYANRPLNFLSTQCGSVPVECENIYNVSEEGDRLIFPANFGWDKVLVRFYEDISLRDIQIPMIAVPTFVTGLKWYDNRWKDDVNSQRLADKYAKEFAAQNFGLIGELNKYKIAELRMLLNAPVFMPSWIKDRNY